MTADYTEPEINAEIAAQAEIEQKNEIVALDDTDGSWKLNLGDGFHTQWQEIIALLTSRIYEDDNDSSIHSDSSSIDNTTDITEDKVFVISLLGNTSSGKSFVARHLLGALENNDLNKGPICVDETEKRGATTVNINCYLSNLMNNQKTLILDYEGEKGSAFPLLHFAQRRFARVLRTAEKAQQRRQAVTNYFPKLAYILSNVVILIGNDDFASVDYLTRCCEFALKANDGVTQMVNLPELIIVQNKGSLAQSQSYKEITKKFFDIHGQDAAVLRRYFSDIKCFCLPHREYLQRSKNVILDGHELFNQQMADMEEIFLEIRHRNLERSLTHAQWLYLLQRILPIVQSGKSVSLHTLLGEIVTPDDDRMTEISRYCFLHCYGLMLIHSPAWFDYCCRFAVRVLTHLLAIQNYNQPELMSERIVTEQCDKALRELSDKLEEYQPCGALYTGKGRSSKNKDAEHPVYCYQHRGAHKNGHRTCQSVYGLALWKEFFGWISTDVWSGEFVSSTRNNIQNTIFSQHIVIDMPDKVRDLMNRFRQDQKAVYDIFTNLLKEEFSDEPMEVFRDVCFGSQTSTSPLAVSHPLVNKWKRPTRQLRRMNRVHFTITLLRSFMITPRSLCQECHQEFHASWNKLSTHRLSSNAQNFQTPTRELSECAICFDAQRDFLFVPCGHRGCCGECTDKILQESGYCPFCRARISGKQRVHDT